VKTELNALKEYLISKTKHTPGPWKKQNFEREDERGIAVVDSSERVVAWLFSASKNSFSSLVPSALPTEGNASLIETAPEMLEELKRLHEEGGCADDTPDLKGRCLCHIIAKAEGRS
jgi:hypothetical protein